MMRSVLRFGGPPQGAPAEDNIGPMPNLESAIRFVRPDLYSEYHPAGWSYPAVPRTVGGSTIGSVVLPSDMLAGNSHSTYWNWNLANYGGAYTPSSEPPVSDIYVDNLIAGGVTWTEMEPCRLVGTQFAGMQGAALVTGFHLASILFTSSFLIL